MAGLAVFAVLFAPADRWPLESSPVPGAIDPRILAPTVRDAVVAASPRIKARSIDIAEQRSGPESIFPSVALATLAVLLVASLVARGLPGSRRLPLVLLRSLVPRAPPLAQAA